MVEELSKNGQAGAPEGEIEITPEMIEAGADVIFADREMVSVWGLEGPSILAARVFSAMELAHRRAISDRKTGAETQSQPIFPVCN